MAAVSQTITPVPKIQLFSGLPFGTNNIYPRARVIFEDDTAVTLKAAGNTNTIIYQCNLPANYAYRLDTVSIQLGLTTSTEVDQIEDLGQARLLFGGAATKVVMPLQSIGLISNATVAGGTKIWNLVEAFSEVFYQEGSTTAPSISFRLFDNDGVNETVAQSGLAWITFLQYDIQQVTDVSVNAPTPVSVV